MDRKRLLKDVKSHPKKYTFTKLAIKYKTSWDAVYGRIKRAGLANLVLPETAGQKVSSSQPQEVPVNKEQIAELVKAERDVLRWRDKATLVTRKYGALQRDYLNLRKEQAAILELEAAPRKKYRIRATQGSGGEATALLTYSDFHVEEEVKPSMVNGLNKFNLDIAEKRAKKCFERSLRLVRKEQQNVTIENVVMALLGDFISGNIHDELLASCLLRPTDAIIFAEDLLISGIEFFLENSKLKLIIPCKVGNHSRITGKVHISGETGNSLETPMYKHMAKHFKDEERVHFIIDDSYLTYLDVYDTTLRLSHGHSLRFGGGVGGLHIPLRKAIAGWNDTRKAQFDALGHFHNYSNTTPTYNCNGSLIGYNPFAVWIKAKYEPAVQSFTLIDKKRGITAQFPIFCE